MNTKITDKYSMSGTGSRVKITGFKIITVIENYKNYILSLIVTAIGKYGDVSIIRNLIGGIVGFLLGYALKKIAILYFESNGIMNINWDKLQGITQTTISSLTGLISTADIQ